MRSQTLRFTAVALGLTIAAAPAALRARIYASPDHSLRAVITDDAAGESLVRIEQIAPVRLLITRDERSADGQHGQGVFRAAWTPDSQFFVVSTSESGGHQPWAHPLWIYSRAKNRVLETSGFLAVSGEFTLKAPDLVQVSVMCKGEEREGFQFSLRHLLATGSVPDPCSQR